MKSRAISSSVLVASSEYVPGSLAAAGKRLKRYQPEVYQRNILEPIYLNERGFDSIGLTHLLHCLPGTMETKETAFRNILPLLNPGGTVFGSTFLYRGIERNLLANVTFWWTNRLGFMSNKQDSLEGLEKSLKKYFSESCVYCCGCEALFRARL